MGTPEFAVATLDAILNAGHEVVCVVTTPDKPAGRGQQMHCSDVKRYALEHQLPILQPEKLKDDSFVEDLRDYRPDVFVVVAFRMLPRCVYAMPMLGTFNVHASLLPQYRGAAPIQRAIMNGERETGVTAFLIDEKLDEGRMLCSVTVPVAPDETGGELHDALLDAAAPLMFDTLRKIEEGSFVPVPQPLNDGTLPTAPKIFREDCRIRWNRPVEQIYNQIRALSPYPGAFTTVRKQGGGEAVLVKIFKAVMSHDSCGLPAGTVTTDNRHTLSVAAPDGCLRVEELQLFGKRRMSGSDFLAGNKGCDGAVCLEEEA